MWRALGGLVAISMLSVCATTPKPVRRTESEDKPPTADNIYWLTRDTLEGAVGENARQNCGARGDAGARHGLVAVVVRRGPEGTPLIETQKSADLNEDDQTCVASATYQAVESLRREWGPENFWRDLGNRVTFSVAVATPPLVPAGPPPEF